MMARVCSATLLELAQAADECGRVEVQHDHADHEGGHAMAVAAESDPDGQPRRADQPQQQAVGDDRNVDTMPRIETPQAHQNGDWSLQQQQGGHRQQPGLSLALGLKQQAQRQQPLGRGPVPEAAVGLEFGAEQAHQPGRQHQRSNASEEQGRQVQEHGCGGFSGIVVSTPRSVLPPSEGWLQEYAANVHECVRDAASTLRIWIRRHAHAVANIRRV